MTLLLNEWDECLIGGRIHHRRAGAGSWTIGRAPFNAARINDFGDLSEQGSQPRMTASEVNKRHAEMVERSRKAQRQVENDFLAPLWLFSTPSDTGSPDASSSSSDVSGGGGDFSGAGASGDF